MTATMPRRGPSDPGGPVNLLREYRLYRFFNDAGELLYLGMTGRMSLERLLEHVKLKPWARDVACWERDPRIWRSEAECLEAERLAIIAERPIHNVAHNGNNRGPVAVRQVPARRPNPPRSAPSVWVRVSRTLPFRVAVLWLALAVVVALLVGWLAVRVGQPLPVRWAAGVGAFAAAGVLVRWWRRVRRLLRRR